MAGDNRVQVEIYTDDKDSEKEKERKRAGTSLGDDTEHTARTMQSFWGNIKLP